MSFEVTSLEEKGIYTLYPMYESLVKDLEAKEFLSDEDQIKLKHFKNNIAAIENYVSDKLQAGIRWSLATLFQEAGMNPTLILEFYPGTKSYKKYGKETVVNVEYTEEDLRQIFESIRNGSPRVTGTLKYKSVPSFQPDELNTGDIFGIQFVG
ncbi:hypothetical protein [Flavobacterium hungaricum]|uniref:Uncharacterized protein n=1 Tax=Flavobacterium hungaricum TaxID=2082725 RepID=A0ABR9TRK0_9FLAO|nr:hypothetical protein [Flavobacterium hungaricum]MBE8727993.1 hypothetical protein [Flavobacterium hungaricum]